MTPAPEDPLVGKTLDGRYLIRSRIARGGMAMVYLANDVRLERRVAIKVMHPHLAEDENFTRRFEREARSAAKLSHPNLVNVFDQGVDHGSSYLVMEYLPSMTLRQLLKERGALSIDEATEIGAAVLAGLAAAHRAEIVHRDLKPENVLLADDGRIKLGDFGLARAASANTTTGQALLGTIAYLSPELITRGIADTRSDLYAFGIMLYEMLTGEQPYRGEQPMQIAYQHANNEVPLPSLLAPDVSPELDDFVRWLTRREPSERPAEAAEAARQLSAIMAGTANLVAPTETKVFDTDALGALGHSPTPSTTVLSDVQQAELAAGGASSQSLPRSNMSMADPAPTATRYSRAEAPETAIEAAATESGKRRQRGRWIALLVFLLVGSTGFAGWWFGQGPGSQVTVPNVSGASIEEAQAALETEDLLVDIVECPSLEVQAGLASTTDPAAGSRLDRGERVTLCQSTGPQLLDVPTLVGLTEDEAITAISEAKFTFGEITDRRFSGEAEGVVLAALGSNGEGLGDTYPEQGRIDLVVSVGSIPDVRGQSPEDATATLSAVELTVDSGQNVESFSDDVAEGEVISLITTTGPVRPGDTVALEISKGPELFEVPNVIGMNGADARATLQNAGFNVELGSALLQAADAIGQIARIDIEDSDPEPGAMRPKGSTVTIS